MGTEGAIRVAVVDDHPLYREGVAAVLSGAGDFQIVGQGACADDAIRIAGERTPEVLLLDIHMPGNGLAVARRLSQSHPAVKIVMLTVSEEESHVSIAMKAGAAGYILKGVTGAELARIIREIHHGARYVSPALAARILTRQGAAADKQAPHRSVLSELTQREGQVMGHVARGLTNKEVARALALSDKTVKHYMTSIMQKLRVRNRMQVVLMASDKNGIDDARVGGREQER